MLKPDGGTLIHGTGRPEDLIPCFLNELERLLDEGRQDELRDDPINKRILDSIEKNDDVPYDLRDEATEFQIELEDALDEYANKFGYRFGGLEGDPSDYGFWVTNENGELVGER